VHIGLQIADNLHPVANPAVDLDGNIYVTFSGPRGQRVPVSLYKITANYSVKPFITSLMNPSGLALDRMGNLFVSCRSDGTIHRITPDGRAEEWIEGMGSPRELRLITTAIYTLETAAARFQDQPEPRDFCFCYARALHRRVSPGVSSQRRSVRFRADDL